MTLLDSLRPTRTADEPGAAPRSGWRSGAIAAALSAVPVMGVVIFGWLVASPRGTGFGQALGVAASGWLLAHGARLGLGAGVVAFTPLLVLAALIVLTRNRARRLIDAHPAQGPLWGGLIEVDLLRALLAFIAGYAGVGLLGFLLSLLAPTHPTWSSMPLAVLGVPILGVGAAAAELLVDGRTLGERLGLPTTIRRAIPAAIRGMVAALIAGSGLVLLSMLVHAGQVVHINGQLAPGLVGGVLLWLGQMSALPNFGVWALSFAAGPGYALTDAASASWSGAKGGLLPLLPIYAASPQPGQFGWYAMLLVVLPISVGCYVGRAALANMPKLAATSSKLGAVLLAALGAAVLLGLVDVIAGASLGVRQLAHLGAPALSLVGALAAEFVVGALLVLGWDLWRLHRR